MTAIEWGLDIVATVVMLLGSFGALDNPRLTGQAKALNIGLYMVVIAAVWFPR